MAGGVRNEGDAARADKIESMAAELGLDSDLSVERNISSLRMEELFRSACCAIHTMRDEHFGISCVEFKAAGILTVGHDSAGPGLDILIPYQGERTGFLAADLDAFADCLDQMFSMPQAQRVKIAENGKKSAKIFNLQNFRANFVDETKTLFL